MDEKRQIHNHIDNDDNIVQNRRLMIAAMAMQGLLASPTESKTEKCVINITNKAFAYADALIQKLHEYEQA